ncbi:hypothetical protein [Yersinia enterocolitica]|uniref:hypothetical protein n=1 Tax=Yersinia enterocolitica TaxID=630 RepID=UPI0029A9BAAF|nr:hypothetical protein [Yersinia enterocolitica]HEI6739895.1 hypothetical protein [Yersinia enterocolitica]HEI6857234.1 hypothetical protein [Yersinia enterocolitica]
MPPVFYPTVLAISAVLATSLISSFSGGDEGNLYARGLMLPVCEQWYPPLLPVLPSIRGNNNGV